MDGNKELTALGYSKSAPVYDTAVGHLYLGGIRRLMPRLRVPPYPAILDVGSGTGINLLEAARHFGPARALHGIDISPGMVEIATAKAQMSGIPAQFTVGDAERLPFPDRTFDLVICNSVLHWFRDRAAAVAEMHRVLRPGGQLALICAAAPGFNEWFTVLQTAQRLLRGPFQKENLPQLPTGQEVLGYLMGSGFTVEHFAHPVHRQRVLDPVSFVRQMSVVAPQWIADLSPGEHALLEHTILSLMRSAGPLGFRNTWAAVETIGTRTAV